MEIIKRTPKNGMHPAVPELQESLRKGKISRREFLRFAGLLGLSAGTASLLANCAPPPAPTAVAPTAVPPTAVPPTAVPPTAVPPTAAPVATEAPVVSGITRGGKLVCASRVQKVTHPAQFSWVSASNQLRQVAEYLTQTDKENITHPL